VAQPADERQHSGSLAVDGQTFGRRTMLEFISGSSPDMVSLEDGAGFLCPSARPHNERYVRGGPFVMDTRQEIQQPFEDDGYGTLF
jgi:redox-sensitive bicupin YhaK (pirin superfamily)